MTRSPRWLAPALLCALVFGLYAGALSGSFQFDDTTSIVENAAIRTLDPRAWWHFWAGRVLTYGSFALDWRVHGLQPAGFHAVNVAIHAAATLAAAWLAAGLAAAAAPRARGAWIAWMAAAVFAVHPLQTQAVTYIVQRAASLCAALYLAALAAYLHARRAQAAGQTSSWALPLAVLLGVLACLTKEMAVTLPLAVLLVDAVAFPGTAGRWHRVAPMLPLVLIVPAVAALGRSFGIAGSALTHETAEVGRASYALTQLDVVARYLRLVIAPVGQNVDHDIAWRHAWTEGSPPLALLALIHVAWLGASVWAWVRGHRLWAFCGAWWGLTLLPESSVFPIRDAMFEHRVYLPLLGPALLVGLLVERMARRRGLIAAVTGGVVIAALGTATVLRNQVWATPESLWRDAVAKSPAKGRPHMALGAALGRQGRWTAAASELERAVALRPNYEEAWTDLGNVRYSTGDLRGAIVAYRSALQANREHVTAWRNLAGALDRAGDLEGATEAYQQALQRTPEDGAALNGLAAVRLRQGRLTESLELARRAVALGQGAPRLVEQIERAAAASPSPSPPGTEGPR